MRMLTYVDSSQQSSSLNCGFCCLYLVVCGRRRGPGSPLWYGVWAEDCSRQYVVHCDPHTAPLCTANLGRRWPCTGWHRYKNTNKYMEQFRHADKWSYPLRKRKIGKSTFSLLFMYFSEMGFMYFSEIYLKWHLSILDLESLNIFELYLCS